MEYNVPAKNIREDKLLCADEKGLPVFVSNPFF